MGELALNRDGLEIKIADSNTDHVYNSSSYAKIFGGAGNDDILNHSSDTTIITGAGNDEIWLDGTNNLVNAGDGNDIININIAEHNTLIGGAGDDTIFAGHYSLIEYNDGDGNDAIYCISQNDTIKVNDGLDGYEITESSLVLKSGDGNIAIESRHSINLSGAKSQAVKCRFNLDNIEIGIIENNSVVDLSEIFKSNIINNQIYNEAANVLIKLTDYDDNFLDNGENSTINAGLGNDIISGGSARLIQYAEGDGNDTIYYSSNDTINITNGTYSSEIEDRNVIFKIGEGSITVVDGVGKNITLKDAEGNVTSKIYDVPQIEDSVPSGDDTVPAETISGSNDTISIDEDQGYTSQTVDGINVVNFIQSVSWKGSSEVDSVTTIVDNVTIDSDGGNDFIYNYASNSLIDAGDGDDYIVSNGSCATINAGNGADSINNSNEGVLINGGDGDDFIEDSGTAGTIIGGKGDDLINNASHWETGKVFKYSEGDGNDQILAPGLSDTIEIDGIVDDVYVSSSSSSGVIYVTLYIGNGSISLQHVWANIGENRIHIKDNTGDITSKVYGVDPNDTLDSTDPNSTLPGGNDTLSIETIPAGQIYNGTKKADLLIGGDGDDNLIGGKGKDTLTGGKGNDVFIYANGDGNDIITDYTYGEDVIKLTSGSIKDSSLSGLDVVLKIGSGSLKLKNAKNKKITVIDSEDKTTSKVYGATTSTSTTLTVTNSTPVTVGSAIKTIDASKRTKTVKITGNTLANTIKGGTKADTIYGGAGNDSIIGNAGNDKLYGDAGNDKLLGGAGADTLTGGKGNDTLTGGAGKDVFVYASGDGKDVITDYTAKQDKIKLTSGTISSSSIKGSDVVLKIGTGSITVKDGKGKSITVVDSKGKSTSKVYGTSKKNYWFTEDDNIITSEIHSIINNDSKLISNDYNYDFNSTLTNQLNQTLVTNLTKLKTK